MSKCIIEFNNQKINIFDNFTELYNKNKIKSKKDLENFLNIIYQKYYKNKKLNLFQNLINDLKEDINSSSLQKGQKDKILKLFEEITDFNFLFKNGYKISSNVLYSIKKEDISFIPKFNGRLNIEVIEQLQKKIFATTIWNRKANGGKGQIIFDNTTLNYSIYDYKNELYKVIYNYLKNKKIYDQHNEYSIFYDVYTKELHFDSYINTMLEMKKVIDSYGDKLITGSLYNQSNELQPIIAFYILNNFDEVISKLSGDIIDIKNEGSLEFNLEKYSFKKNRIVKQNWDESLNSKDASLHDNHLVNYWIQSIEYEPNKFISKEDIEKIYIFIQKKINTSRSVTLKNIDDLINLLKNNKEINEFVGENIIEALIEELEVYNDAFQDLFKTEDEFGVFEEADDFITDKKGFQLLQNTLNLPLSFIKQIENHNPGAYEIINTDGSVTILTAIDIKKPKQHILNSIKTVIANNLKYRQNQYYSIEYLYDGKNSVYDRSTESIHTIEFRTFLQAAFGIHINDRIINKLYEYNDKKHTIMHLFNLLNDLQYIVQNFIIENAKSGMSLAEAIEDEQLSVLLDELQYNENYINFTNILVEDNPNTSVKLRDSQGNTQAQFLTTNQSLQFNRNLEIFNDFNTKNIFLRFPELTNIGINKTGFKYPIGFRKEINLGNDKKINDLNITKEEHLSISIMSQYFYNMIKDRYFSIVPVATSDKPNPPNIYINTSEKLSSANDKTFEHLTSKEIFEIYYQQFSGFWNNVERNILNKYSLLLNQRFNTIVDLNNYLSENAVYLKDINIGKVELIQLHDYITDKQGRVYLNGDIYNNISLSKNIESFKSFINASYKSFLQNVKESNIYIFDVLRDIKNLKSPNNEDVLTTLRNFCEEIIDAKSDNFNQILEDFQKSEKIEDSQLGKLILTKYFLTFNLLSDAYNQIVVKPYENHKGGDLSARYVTSTKRNNSAVATVTPFVTDQKETVPKVGKLAIVNDSKRRLFNFIGHTHNQDVHDGSLFISPIVSNWMRQSILNKELKGTMKVIGFVKKEATLTQFKCAAFTPTNAKLKFYHDNENGVDMRHLVIDSMRVSIPTITDESFIKQFNAICTPNFYRYIDGKKYNYNGLSLGENGKLQINFISENVLDNQQKDIKTFTAEYFWEMWEILGAEFAYETTNDGEVTSESSFELISDFVSEYDYKFKTNLKSEFTAIYANSSAVKSSAINVNESYDQESFMTMDFRWDDFGIQNDASHDADESEMSNPTQAYNNIAFNGMTADLAQEVWESLSQLMESNLEAMIKYYGYKYDIDEYGNRTPSKDQREFNKRIAKILKQNLESSKDVSDGINILNKIIEQHSKNPEAPIRVPVDSPDLFYKLASMLHSDLNNKVIRAKTSGIAGVLNPSHGIVTVFEDEDGRVMNKEDLIKKARQLFNEGNLYINPNIWNYEIQDLSDSDLLDIYLQSNYKDKVDINITDITLGDTVWIPELNKEIKIETPQQLAEIEQYLKNEQALKLTTQLEDNQKIAKRLSKGRDLKPTQITWESKDLSGNITYHNMWTHPLVLNMLRFKDSKKPEDKIKYNKSLLLFRDLLTSLSKRQSFDVKIDENGNILTDERGKIIRNYYNIYNFNHKPGEQIVPKVFKSAFNIGGKTLYELSNESLEHFRNIASNKLVRTIIEPANDNSSFVHLVTDEKEIVIDTELNLQYGESPEFIEGDYWFVNSFGKKICKAFSKNDLIYIDNTGTKPIIYIQTKSENITSVSDFKRKIKSNIIDELEENTTAYYSNFDEDILIDDSNLKYKTYNIHDVLKSTKLHDDIEEMSTALYNSFLTTNDCISIRIPTQSFQSFMALQTVGYIEENTNDIFVNIYEIWFQGSK